MHPLTLHSSATDQDWVLIAIVNDLRAVDSNYISKLMGSVKKSNECGLHSLVQSHHCLSGGNGEWRARVRDNGHLPDADRCLICLLCVMYVLLHYSFHARVDPQFSLNLLWSLAKFPYDIESLLGPIKNVRQGYPTWLLTGHIRTNRVSNLWAQMTILVRKSIRRKGSFLTIFVRHSILPFGVLPGVLSELVGPWPIWPGVKSDCHKCNTPERFKFQTRILPALKA